MSEYDFSEIGEIVTAIGELYEKNEQPSAEEREPLQQAIRDFFRTRTVSEMFDIYDWSDGANQISIHDYQSWLIDPFEEEMNRRSVWIPSDVRSVLNKVLPEWTGKDSIVSRMNGIQKKLDKIVKILDKFEIKVSVKEMMDM